MVETRALERTRLMGPSVEIDVDNALVPKERVVKDAGNGADKVVNLNQGLLLKLIKMRKSMEEIQSKIKRENLKLRRLVEVMS